MLKKIAVAVTALILILTGCSFRPWEYPRVSSASLPEVQPVTIGITVPRDADEAIEAAVLTLQAKLGELSDGSIKLEVYHSNDVAYDLEQGEPGLYLLDDLQMVKLDSRLSFIQMPFLFESSEQMLTMLNSVNGKVRSKYAAGERLGGEVLGVYYGGTSWFMGKTRLYDEVGFYNSVGVLKELAGNDCFATLGTDKVTQGSSEELFELFAAGTIKYCELRPDDEIPDAAVEKMKSLELTNHRFGSRWMILRDNDNTLEPIVKSMIKEAFSYTVAQHDNARRELDTVRMTRLEERVNMLVQEDASYHLTIQTARRYYRQNWEALGIPKDIWAEIQMLKGY